MVPNMNILHVNAHKFPDCEIFFVLKVKFSVRKIDITMNCGNPAGGLWYFSGDPNPPARYMGIQDPDGKRGNCPHGNISLATGGGAAGNEYSGAHIFDYQWKTRSRCGNWEAASAAGWLQVNQRYMGTAILFSSLAIPNIRSLHKRFTNVLFNHISGMPYQRIFHNYIAYHF